MTDIMHEADFLSQPAHPPVAHWLATENWLADSIQSGVTS